MPQTPPAQSLLWGDPHGFDYCDCVTAPLSGASCTVDQAAYAFFTAGPAWLPKLMALRDRLVGPLGLKTSNADRLGPTETLQIGRQIGLFRVLARNAEEIILGEDDSHLDFRVSILLQRQNDGGVLAVSTALRRHNHLGRLYFALVRPFHHYISQAVTRAMGRRLSRVLS